MVPTGVPLSAVVDVASTSVACRPDTVVSTDWTTFQFAGLVAAATASSYDATSGFTVIAVSGALPSDGTLIGFGSK